MATLTLKNTTGSDIFIQDIGIIIPGPVPGPAEDTFTDDGLLRTISSSRNTREFVTSGALVVNDGISDLSIPIGLTYLAQLWFRSGFDSNPIKIKEIEVDFGLVATVFKTFTIVDTDVRAESVIAAWKSGKAATGKTADEITLDDISFSVNPGSGSFTLVASALNGPVTGAFKIVYIVSTPSALST